jgi:uncharacterized phiE125 gp8 family phage protein
MAAIIKDIEFTEAGGSATEIVSVAELKEYLQIEGTAYDNTLAIFITAARQFIEAKCNISLIEKSVIVTIYSSNYKPFELPYSPITSITQVKWRKCPSEWQILIYDDEYSTFGNNRVSIESSEVGLHEISYTLGVDTKSVFIQAVKAQAGYFFNNRDSDKENTMAPECKALLFPFMPIC